MFELLANQFRDIKAKLVDISLCITSEYNVLYVCIRNSLSLLSANHGFTRLRGVELSIGKIKILTAF